MAVALITLLVGPFSAATASTRYLPAVPVSIANNYYRTTDAKMILAMNVGMEIVSLRLKDPKDLEFRDVYFNKGAGRLSVTCGSVKVMGSYQYFVSTGAQDMTYLEREAKNFSDLWAALCQGTVPGQLKRKLC